MDQTRDTAFKLGCGRLIFEHGALGQLGVEVKRLGRKAYVVSGEKAFAQVGKAVQATLKNEQIAYLLDVYAGACSEEKADQIAKACRESGCEVMVGLGGGRIMDLSKMAAEAAKLPVINVPTISATCAAYTPLSVVYAPQGACKGTWYFRREVDCVLCDLDVLCAQSPRFLAAGVVDALAKHVEIAHHKAKLEGTGQDARIAELLAKTLYDDLLSLAPEALAALNHGVSCTALERCIFHTIVTTGLISGMARGMYQSALGHALYEAVRTLYPEQSKPSLHGEVVGVGLIVQEYYLDNAAGAQRLTAFMKAAGMPVNLREIGVEPTEKALQALSGQSPVPDYFLHGAQDRERVLSILQHQ